MFPVHGVGGIMGTLLTGVFGAAALGGVGHPDGRTILAQVGVQLIGTVATVAWSGGMTWLLLKVTARFCALRVTAEEENEGLDLVLHEERGYNITS